ncbi:MAG: hypothetical protein QXG10_02295 [Candidatus Hadarchaeales archaeon]
MLTSLAIKRRGKFVDLHHIREKLSRDAGRKFSETETGELLESLVNRGLVEEKGEEYAITEAGRAYFERRWREIKNRLNPDYLKVYRAKRYYPHVHDALLKYCRGRWVSVFRLFTGRSWLQRKIGPRYITINSWDDIERWLDIHGIDFIPYIHGVNSDRPDWLVIDFDAGERVKLETTKKVVTEAAEILSRLNVLCALKFSGSRGFQLWAKFKKHELPEDYRPKPLKTGKRERNMFSFYSDIVRFIEQEISQKLPGVTTSQTAGKEERKDRVLLDASIIKPMGDVRAPYSMHHRTGLISAPIEIEELKRFVPEMADPDAVAERYEKRGDAFTMEESDGDDLFRAVVKWCAEA